MILSLPIKDKPFINANLVTGKLEPLRKAHKKREMSLASNLGDRHATLFIPSSYDAT